MNRDFCQNSIVKKGLANSPWEPPPWSRRQLPRPYRQGLPTAATLPTEPQPIPLNSFSIPPCWCYYLVALAGSAKAQAILNLSVTLRARANLSPAAGERAGPKMLALWRDHFFHQVDKDIIYNMYLVLFFLKKRNLIHVLGFLSRKLSRKCRAAAARSTEQPRIPTRTSSFPRKLSRRAQDT